MKRLVLASAGHTHAQVLLDWSRSPLPAVELVVVSPQASALYSGMVPGWLAGINQFDEMAIGFPALGAASGARWVAADLAALDPDRRRISLSTGESLDYDVLARPRQLRPDRLVHGGLVTNGSELLPGQSAPARGAAKRTLVQAHVTLKLGSRWCGVIGRSSDLVLGAIGAEAHDWQRDLARRGSLAVNAQGRRDCGAHGPCAVKQPARRLGKLGLRRFIPNTATVLGALSIGDGRAIASHGPFGAVGASAWRWKDYIDRRFIARYAAPTGRAS